jgi:SET domain-containing protein
MPFVSDSYHSRKLELRQINRREVGVFATRALARGEILTISGGLVLPYRRVRAFPPSFRRFCFYIEYGYFLVPSRRRAIGLGFYVNHSCAPNAGDLKGEHALTCVALRPIRRGEEITCDYRPVLNPDDTQYRPLLRFRCRCRAPGCAGFIRA